VVLNRHFRYNFEENPKYGGDVKPQKEEEKARVECTIKAHSGLKCVVKAYLKENKA
jgi:hypothetical protein